MYVSKFVLECVNYGISPKCANVHYNIGLRSKFVPGST